jgi:hypothetical protein
VGGTLRIALPAFVSLGWFLAADPVWPQSMNDLEKRITELEKIVAGQSETISEQQKMLVKQQLQLDLLRQVEPLRLDPVRGGAAGPATGLPPILGQSAQTDAPEAAPQPVGEPPPAAEPERPEVAVIYERGGVLTPRGALILEPSIELVHASVNRFTFRGVEVQDVILIGIIEASDADRNLVSPALTARLGVTERMELEFKIPYIYRNDRVTFLVPVLDEDGSTTQSQHLEGSGLGDIEAAVHYQITDGPLYLVGNLRGKSTTGEGPFDVDRDAFGIATELPTGSGFYAVEPSLTFLYPTDPAILFATLSYQVNFSDSMNKQIGDVVVLDVDPGDVVGASVGLGFAINEELSFSLGYKHSYVFESETEVFNPDDGSQRKFDSEELQIGSLLLGMNYRVSDRVQVSLDFELGVTSDAPDVRATLRVPIVAAKLF